MTVNSYTGGDPNVTEASAHSPGDEVDLHQLISVLRRRWWVIAVAALVALSAAWARDLLAVDQYSATALLEKEVRSSPLEGLTSSLAPGSTEPLVGTQIEVIKSNAVLRPVVDSLGLRLLIERPQVARGSLFEVVELDPRAAPRAFLLDRGGAKGGLVLRDAATERVLATAGPDGWIEGAGIRLLLVEPFVVDDPIRLRLIHGETAVNRLRRDLRVNQVGRTSLIRVGYTDPDPELAMEVVATVATMYQQHAAANAREEARRRRQFIAQQLAVIADSLQRAQAQQLEYQERSGTLNPQTEAEALIRAVMEAESEVRLRRYHESILTTLNRSLRSEGEADEALRRTVALGSAIVPGAETLYARLQDLQTERSRLTSSRFGYTASGAEVEVLDSLISATKAEMREMSQQALEVISTRRAAAEDRVAELRSEVRNLPARSTGYVRLRQQADAIQATFDVLASKYYEAQIAEAIEGGDVQIVDPPIVPVLPDPSHTTRDLVLALVLGLMMGMGGAFGIEYFDRRVRGSEDAEAAGRLRVLASIPRVREGLNGFGRPVLTSAERTPAGEAFRSLNTMIRFSRVERPRILAVTSPEPGAGKSTVAANLAVVLGQNHPRVLLVDADFPRPVQHRIFETTRQPGLSDLLVGDAAFEEVVRHHADHGIDFIPSGSPVPNSADLLGSETFREFVAHVAQEYDAVVVDSSPAMVLADSAALAPVMDGLLLVVRVGATDRDALRAAAEQLRGVGGSVLGIVLNDVPESQGYGGYRYHEYFQSENGRQTDGVVNRLRRLIRT